MKVVVKIKSVFGTRTDICHISTKEILVKNENVICTTIFLLLHCYNQIFENKNISYFSFYQSQHDGVFHNQVLRCASRAACPQGLSGERGEYQVLRTLSRYYHHTVMALCPILLCNHHPNHPPTRKQDGTTTAACSAALSTSVVLVDFFFFLFPISVLRNGERRIAQNMEDSFCAGNLQAWRHQTKMERVISFFGKGEKKAVV